MNVLQRQILLGKSRFLQSYKPPDWHGIVSTEPPMNSRPVVIMSAPYPNIPAPGPANAVNVITPFQVPAGQIFVVNALAIFFVGGGFVDGSGSIIWRVKVNGAAVKGLNNLQGQLGTSASPQDLILVLRENDILTITVESTVVTPGTTGAKVVGYQIPIVNRN